MEQASAKNGRGSMTMPAIMICPNPRRVQNMSVQFLGGLVTILILAGEEQADHQTRKVRFAYSLVVFEEINASNLRCLNSLRADIVGKP